MKGGVVQQIGTPAEIYSTPSNLFVADFMGSPAMNLIPAKAKKNGTGYNIVIERAGGEPLVLHDRRIKKLPSNVVVGLRPEDIGDAQYRKGRDLHVSSCKVGVVEPAGADTFVLMSLGGKEVTARLHAETGAIPGKEMKFAFDMKKLSYFDADTGDRLELQ
jgi:multiple sugar transport system ATP-binding protein